MSFWNWLTGSASVALPDLIWLSNRGRAEGAWQRIIEQLPTCRLVVVMSYFSDRLTEFSELLDRESVAYRRAEHAVRPRDIQSDFSGQEHASLLIAPASLLVWDKSPSLASDPSSRVWIAALERHPMLQFDDRIAAFARAITCKTQLQFFLSLDDALLGLFSGGWVRQTLIQLGMQENEAINSRVVSRRIRGAQRRVTKRFEQLQGMMPGEVLLRLANRPSGEWKNGHEWLADYGLLDVR